MAYGATRTRPTPTTTHSGGFIATLTASDFLTASIDGGSSSLANGGGDLRIYEDDTKATQYPIHVITFVTGGSPQILVKVRLPTWASGDTIYYERDEVATSQPAAGSTYGYQNVYQDCTHAFYGDDFTYNYVDSTTAASSNGTVTTGSDANGDYTNFDGSSTFFDFSSAIGTISSGTISFLARPENMSGDGNIFAHSDFPGSARLYFGFDSSERLYYRLGSSTARYGSTSKNNTLCHGALNISGGNGTAYLDGAVELSSTSYSGSAGSSSHNTVIGAYHKSDVASTNTYFKGRCYYVYKYSTARTAAYITDEAANAVAGAFGLTGGTWADSGGASFEPAWAANSNILIQSVA